MKKVINLTLYNIGQAKGFILIGGIASNIIATRVEGEDTCDGWITNRTIAHCES